MSLKKQSSQIQQMTRQVNFSKDIPAGTSLSALQLRLNQIEKLNKEFEGNQTEVEEQTGKEGMDMQFGVRAQFEELYYACHVKLQDKINEINDALLTNESLNNSRNTPRQQEVKLPRIELTPFSGEYEDWSSFRDLFSSLIHTNANIAGVQKLHYLKANVQGDAERLLRSIQVTEANYTEAWKKLTDRYEHKRYIVDCLLKGFLSQSKIWNENPSDIKKLIDKSSEIMQSLKLQGIPVGHWDSIVVHIIVSKLDSETHRQWELKQTKDELPRFKDLEEFLEGRWQSLEMIQQASSTSQSSSQLYNTRKYNFSDNYGSNASISNSNGQRSSVKCFCCSELDHRLFKCPKYNRFNVEERKGFLKGARLCFNCLSNGHMLGECISVSRCKDCKGKHHTSIHTELKNSSSSRDQSSIAANNESITHSAVATSSSKKRVLLATAIVYVHSTNGEKRPAKALIDGGSENAAMIENLATKLGLIKTPDSSTVLGLGGIEVPTQNSAVKFQISSHIDATFSMQVEASTMHKITSDLPMIPIHREDWPHLQGIKLADPHFDHPSPIEILLGAEVYEQIIMDGIIPKKDYSPTAQNSRLGWLLFGSVKSSSQIMPSYTTKQCLVSAKLLHLDHLIRSFWEMEEIPEKRKLTVKEQQAEDIFIKNVHQNEEGRYVVALPFDPEKQAQEIGESRKAALSGLFRMEDRFKTNSEFKNRYKNYIQNLIDAKHIELVPRDRLNLDEKDKFYLPHHAVLKEESLTTKLRVVFDASRKSSTGISLNDKLLVGPKTQDDLFSILIRWRKHKYVFIADVEKMYRQVKLISEHRDFQRILWRFEQNDPILEYRVTTVIDGTASAAYLGTRALKQLAEDNSAKYPEASKIVKEDFYVDDMSSGSYSIEKAKQLQNDIIELMNQGKMVLTKWFSNTKQILENVPVENRHDPSNLVELIEKSIKTLGIYWNQREDSYEFKITPCSKKHKLTKRELLSDISKLFDPIGWLAPSTVIAKIFMQSLWTVKDLDWNDKVPEGKMIIWRKYRNQLQELENIKIPRWIGTDEVIEIQLHGFGDASNAAYSAVVYSRVMHSDKTIKINIISAKTKVSPIKTISIPKLELCGSVLLSRLMHKVRESLKIPKVESFTYTDNTTVLAWLKSHPNHYNIFVANRITEVQSLTNTKNWCFIPTDENPADCASRGIYPSELSKHHLWWTGPKWLSLPQQEWPKYQSNYETELEKRKIPVHALHTSKSPEQDYLAQVLKKHSTLVKLIWNTAYVTKFCSQSKAQTPKKVEQPNAQDLRDSLRKWISYIQHMAFKEEIERCKAGDELLARSKLRKLRPFIDTNGLLRVGGRLRKSQLIFNAKHPIILPKDNHFTQLVIEQAHKYTLHGGPTLMSTFLQNYWIFGRSAQIKKSVGSCVICFPHRSKPTQQLMADLPINRVTPHRAFLHTGVDFAGPLTTKTYTGRSRGVHSNPTQKSYVSIFVCLSTKAVHIELVSKLTSAAFLACFIRFTARRGKCTDMYSDNGKNFVAANRELKEQFRKLMEDKELQGMLAKDGVTWHFNPPLSPSFGGLWESGVKSIKYHLKRLIGNNTFTFEEMTTLLCQIEACLNSRPLCPISDDINDVSYLTPGHFLIGEAPITVPEVSLLDEKVSRLSRWKLIQHTYQRFWQLWSSEYLSRLQQRPKWLKTNENVRTGQLVLLREENTPPAKWPMARILKVYPGDDGNVRVVSLEKHSAKIDPPIPRDFKKYLAKLKTYKSILKRPISQISILPIEDNEMIFALPDKKISIVSIENERKLN